MVNLDFLKSNRFWALALLAVAYYFQTHGFVLDPNGIFSVIELVAGGHIVIRTTDRATETLAKKK